MLNNEEPVDVYGINFQKSAKPTKQKKASAYDKFLQDESISKSKSKKNRASAFEPLK